MRRIDADSGGIAHSQGVLSSGTGAQRV